MVSDTHVINLFWVKFIAGFTSLNFFLHKPSKAMLGPCFWKLYVNKQPGLCTDIFDSENHAVHKGVSITFEVFSRDNEMGTLHIQFIKCLI